MVVVGVESRPTNKQLSFRFIFLICLNLNFKKDFYQIKHFLLNYWAKSENDDIIMVLFYTNVLVTPYSRLPQLWGNILSLSHWVRESGSIIHLRDLKGSRQLENYLLHGGLYLTAVRVINPSGTNINLENTFWAKTVKKRSL